MTIEDFNNSGEAQQNLPSSENLANNSGQGSGTPVLDIVAKKFNWGAFLLTCIWGLANKSFITLIILPIFILCFIPFVGWLLLLGCGIWFGIKGNEWAWKNKRWNSIEEFHAVQKKWAIGGIIAHVLLYILCVFSGIILALTLPALMTNTSEAQNRAIALKSCSTLHEAALLNEALDVKCTPTSSGLAKCFAERTNVSSSAGNIITTADGVVWDFKGNGSCKNIGECSVSITDSHGLYEIIPLTVVNGVMKAHTEEVQAKYKK